MSDYTYIDLLDEVDCSDHCEAVIALCELVDKLVADIQQNGKAITELLKNLISMSDDEMRKEAADD